VATFGLLFALMAAVMLGGSLLCNQMLKRFGPQAVMALGAVLIALGGATTFLVADIWLQPLPVLVTTVAVFFIGFGLVVPASGGMALHAFGAMGGLAAAVVGCTQGLVGSAGAIAVGRLYDGSPRALGIGFAVSAVLAVAFTSWLAVRLSRYPALLAHPEQVISDETTSTI
jgi:DHA1 family bicyclomycin/chloramphenicol resistance-like MFS transporter